MTPRARIRRLRPVFLAVMAAYSRGDEERAQAWADAIATLDQAEVVYFEAWAAIHAGWRPAPPSRELLARLLIMDLTSR